MNDRDIIPPGLSTSDYAVLVEARAVDAGDLPVEPGLVVDLLAVYDKLAARNAWLATEHAGLRARVSIWERAAATHGLDSLDGL